MRALSRAQPARLRQRSIHVASPRRRSQRGPRNGHVTFVAGGCRAPSEPNRACSSMLLLHQYLETVFCRTWGASATRSTGRCVMRPAF
jgi:hypothetical protein